MMANSNYKILGLAPLISAVMLYKTPMLIFSMFNQQYFWSGLLVFGAFLTWLLVFVGGLLCVVGHGAGKYILLAALPLSVPLMMISFMPFAFRLLPTSLPVLAFVLAYLINSMVVLTLFWVSGKSKNA